MRERGFFLYDVHKDTFEIYINIKNSLIIYIYIMNASQYYFIMRCVCV